MKTIVITSQKGGSGKTMLAAHLSVEAERKGDTPAWLIDTFTELTLAESHVAGLTHYETKRMR